jgi:hypothetical protein
MIFAVIKDNVVSNIIHADTKEDAEMATGHTCVEVTNDRTDIGFEFNGTDIVIPEVILGPP